MLTQLDAVRPTTPGIQKARRLMQMLGAQIEARNRIGDVIPRMLDYDPATGSEDEAAEMLAELLRAQTDLLRSGVPVSVEQIAQIEKNITTFNGAFGDDYDLLDADQIAAFQRAKEQMRLRRGTAEILGPGQPADGLDYENMLGPELDAEKRRAAEAFLNRNLQWNSDGITLAGSAFTQAIGNDDRWFAPGDMERVRAQWEAWSTPPVETIEQSEAIRQETDASPARDAVEKTTRNLLGRLGS
jgi:hypothetical protein